MVEVRKIETRKRCVNTETIQLGPVGVAKETIGLVKMKKNPKKAIIENQNSYLGYNGMGHHNNEGISGIMKGKGKGKKGSGKGFGKQFQGYCITCECGVTKQSIASHRAKERTARDGIMAIKAKARAKVEQRDSPKARAEE